jgi:hypothetical protein
MSLPLIMVVSWQTLFKTCLHSDRAGRELIHVTMQNISPDWIKKVTPECSLSFLRNSWQ